MASAHNNPMLALLTAASDSLLPVDRLMRVAALAASHLPGQEAFSKWAESELQGYSQQGPVPDYREIQASLFGRHQRGWRVPVRLDASSKSLLAVNIHQPIDEVVEFSKHNSDQKIALWIEPECVKELLLLIPNLVDVWREVTPSTFVTVALGVRRRIFHWAMTQQNSIPTLPAGSIEAALGLRPQSLPNQYQQTDQLLSGAITLNGGQFNVSVMNASPGAMVTQTQHSQAAELISQLIAALHEVQESSKERASSEEAARLREVTGELEALRQLTAPNPKWVSATLDGIQALAKETATAVGAELAKPHIQALLAAAYHCFKSI